MVIIVAIIIKSIFKYKKENYHIVFLVCDFSLPGVLEFSGFNFSTIYLLNGWRMGMMEPLEISNPFESTRNTALAPPKIKAWFSHTAMVQDTFFPFHFKIFHIIIFPRNMNSRFQPVFSKTMNFQRFRNRVEWVKIAFSEHTDFSFCLRELLLAWNACGLRDEWVGTVPGK